jgi:hypothetical protein
MDGRAIAPRSSRGHRASTTCAGKRSAAGQSSACSISATCTGVSPPARAQLGSRRLALRDQVGEGVERSRHGAPRRPQPAWTTRPGSCRSGVESSISRSRTTVANHCVGVAGLPKSRLVVVLPRTAPHKPACANQVGGSAFKAPSAALPFGQLQPEGHIEPRAPSFATRSSSSWRLRVGHPLGPTGGPCRTSNHKR